MIRSSRLRYMHCLLIRLAAVLVVALATGCPHEGTTPKQRPPRGPRVQAFTESAAVTAIVAVEGGYVVTGTSRGLDRFEVRSGATVHLGNADGLPGDGVLALAVDARDGRVWVAASKGLARYEPAKHELTATAATGAPIGAAAGIKALAADPAGGLWVGVGSGLYHVDDGGAWKAAGFTRPVRALHATADGTVWIGTSTGLVERHADGSYQEYGADEGCAFTLVDAVLAAPDGSLVVIGSDGDGQARIAFQIDGEFSTFRPSPDEQFVGATRRMDELILATPERLYALARPRRGARVLRRDGLHLVAVTGPSRRSPYIIRPLDAIAPEITAVAASSLGDLFIGTRTVGTAHVQSGKRKPRWLRRRDLMAGALDFSVACASVRECFVATGASRAWRFDGNGFAPVTVSGDADVTVLAVVRSPEGAVLALHRTALERRLHVSRLVAGGGFVPVAALAVETPGGMTSLTFARFSPDGTLWLGLQYLDEENEPRAYGVAIVDLALGEVTYHHQRAGNDSKKTGILPIPNDVADAAFLPDAAGETEVWFATQSGAARLRGEKVVIYTEAEGLESEILHGIVATGGGLVFVASSSGIGEFDGQRWTWPRVLSLTAHALALGPDGRLWLGTDRGLVAYDGRRLQRIDARAGLLAGSLDDVVVDHLGRVWARNSQGFAIVTP